MAFDFEVDHKSPVPLYVQIMDRTRSLIATGRLQPGDQLPTIRELSVTLTVNPNTVARAYSELEREGLLTTQQGRGTFVDDVEDRTGLDALSRESLCELIDRAITQARTSGYSLAEIQRCMKNQIASWKERSQSGGTDD
jgi:GntR family transcriptional regulator